MSILNLLIVLLLLGLLFGGYTYAPSRRTTWGYWGWSPAALIILVIVLLVLTGAIRV